MYLPQARAFNTVELESKGQRRWVKAIIMRQLETSRTEWLYAYIIYYS